MATKRMFYVTASNQNVGRKKNRSAITFSRHAMTSGYIYILFYEYTFPISNYANLPNPF